MLTKRFIVMLNVEKHLSFLLSSKLGDTCDTVTLRVSTNCCKHKR